MLSKAKELFAQYSADVEDAIVQVHLRAVHCINVLSAMGGRESVPEHVAFLLHFVFVELPLAKLVLVCQNRKITPLNPIFNEFFALTLVRCVLVVALLEGDHKIGSLSAVEITMHLHVVVIDEAVEKIDAKEFQVVVCVFIQCVEAGFWIAVQSIIHVVFCALSVTKLIEVHLRGAVVAPRFLVEDDLADPWVNVLLFLALEVQDCSSDFETFLLSEPVSA